MQKVNADEAANKVVASANMIPPWVEKMYERRPYVTRPDAPAVHARLCYAPDSKTDYCLNFNGVDIITMRFGGDVKPYLRAHSDGDLQSQPMIQQFVMWIDAPGDVRVDFFAPVEMWNMRPKRAAEGEAILGQTGYPLLYGVNGMYLPDWDLMFSWHGFPFTWNESRIVKDEKGWHASMTLHAGHKPWVVELRPHYYGEHLGYRDYKPWERRPNPKPITGWCSWEAYHSDVTQNDIEKTAKSLSVLRPYGLEYMQLDDGYQQKLVPMTDDGNIGESWLNTNEKFTDGHRGIISAVKNGGFKPGIWTNATITNLQAAEKQDFCLRDREGKVICGDWILYPLDMLPETLEKHILPYYRKFREAGYEYVKSDSIRHVIYDGMQEAVRLGVMEPEEARRRFRAYMETARRGLGEDIYYLSCWGVLSQSIGVCDAMRIATDANPSFGAYSMQVRETARWFHAQRVMFTVDPDHVCVRGEYNWVRMMLSFASLSGSLFMISDNVETYDAARLELMKKTMPALATRTAETGPTDYSTPACARMNAQTPVEEASRLISHIDTDAEAPFASLWATHFDENGRSWTVVQRIAVVPLDGMDVPLEGLALDPKRRYCAYDFWNGAVSFVENGALPMSGLTVGDTQVIALNDITDGRPKLIGSDRHISCDAVSVAETAFENGTFVLRLKGFEGLRVKYTLYKGGLCGRIASSNGIAAEAAVHGDIITLDTVFASEEAELVIE